jgi:hypothetical protein
MILDFDFSGIQARWSLMKNQTGKSQKPKPVPAKSATKVKPGVFGCMRGPAHQVGDIVAPVGEVWDAEINGLYKEMTKFRGNRSLGDKSIVEWIREERKRRTQKIMSLLRKLR